MIRVLVVTVCLLAVASVGAFAQVKSGVQQTPSGVVQTQSGVAAETQAPAMTPFVMQAAPLTTPSQTPSQAPATKATPATAAPKP
jgi:hypothetical protein